MGTRSEGSDSEPDTDVFAHAGERIAEVLRVAAEEAARMVADATEEAGASRAAALAEARGLRAAADADAEAVTSAARLRADELDREAQDDRDKAKALLVRARQHADRMVADAEQNVALLTSDAEAQARARVAAVLEAGRARLDQLTADEQLARGRLIDAQNELRAVILRITDGGPFIDLTADEPSVRLDGALRPDVRTPNPDVPAMIGIGSSEQLETTAAITPVVPRSADSSPDRFPVGRGWADPTRAGTTTDPSQLADPTPPKRPGDRTVDADPLNAMVRNAVDRAVAHSSDARPRLRPSDRRRPPR